MRGMGTAHSDWKAPHWRNGGVAGAEGCLLPRASRREVGSHFISSDSHAHMARFMSFKGSFLCLAVPLHTKTCRFIKDKPGQGPNRTFLIAVGMISGRGKVRREGDL